MAAAARCFYDQGIAATGIDTITAEAGVAKMSLYNNFASKAELVEHYLLARHEEWLDLYRSRCVEATTPQQRILAVFDAYLDHASLAYEHGFRGCGLLNAAAELPAGDPGRDVVRRHKEQVEAILAAQLAELTSPDRADRLSTQLAFLLEGAVVRAGLEGTSTRLIEARGFAAELLDTL